MNSEERTIVNVKDDNGDVEEIEIISQILSTRDDKEYIIYTMDKQIEDEVNINVGIINDGFLEVIEDNDEIEYVMSLIDSIVEGE